MMTATEKEQIMVMHSDRVRVSDIRKKKFSLLEEALMKDEMRVVIIYIDRRFFTQFSFPCW